MSFGGLIRRSFFWTADFFKGRPIRKHYTDIKRILKNSENGVKRQSEHLNSLLQHAVSHSPFYKCCEGKSFLEFPVMNKNKLISEYDNIKVDIKYIPEQMTEKIHVQRTSGSTGTPFCVHQDTRKRNRRIAELKYFGDIAGYKSHEKIGTMQGLDCLAK